MNFDVFDSVESCELLQDLYKRLLEDQEHVVRRSCSNLNSLKVCSHCPCFAIFENCLLAHLELFGKHRIDEAVESSCMALDGSRVDNSELGWYTGEVLEIVLVCSSHALAYRPQGDEVMAPRLEKLNDVL